ncbi:MAG TPA: N-acetyltransferase [Ottowia sp.]|uniref:N-acetyltransferase n=1 Tax=Ottowia sp. TaxID=1898956 RepID=UPI002C176765|nr:N-acetyltransferase [Ottowia sp.]HMN22225.1 N-acetyltransferase [Ottowia sp.]
MARSDASGASLNIIRLTAAEQAAWLALRSDLWPGTSANAHQGEIADQLAAPQRFAAFIAHDDEGAALGFAEVSRRSEYVNGTHSTPVAFLEGLYVRRAAHQRLGFAETERVVFFVQALD